MASDLLALSRGIRCLVPLRVINLDSIHFRSINYPTNNKMSYEEYVNTVVECVSESAMGKEAALLPGFSADRTCCDANQDLRSSLAHESCFVLS